MARAINTAAKVIGTRVDGGGNRIANSGRIAPTVNAMAEEIAACHGLVNSSGSRRSSASTWAANASWSVSSSATVRAVAGGQPLGLVKHRQLVEFGGRVGGELMAFEFAAWPFGITLGADGHVLTDAPSTAPPRPVPAIPAVTIGPRSADGRRHPDDNAGGGHDAVVGPEHPGAQPIQPAAECAVVRLGGVGRRVRRRCHVCSVGFRRRPARCLANRPSRSMSAAAATVRGVLPLLLAAPRQQVDEGERVAELFGAPAVVCQVR